MNIDPMVLLVGVGLLSITCQYLAFKVKIPAILPLLVTGILLGPTFGVLDPDALFGSLLFPLVSLSVAIILFEGALTLKFEDLAGHGSMVRNLCTVGAAVTWAVATPVAHYALGMSWQMAFLFGAIVTVTGPTVIVPMLRSVRPTAKVSNILRWEGIVIDPIGALLAVLVYEYIIAVQDAWTHTLLTFGLVLAVGFGLGALMGYGMGLVLRKNWMPHYLQNTAVLTLMLGAFAGSNMLAHESGLLTVTVMGMWLANMKDVEVDDILEFKETLSVLLISALFILLAARLDFGSIIQVGWGAILVLIAIIFIARPISVLVSSIGTGLNWRELGLLSWIAPRGIVAAAVSALFALKLEELGYAEADLLVPMVFLVIIATVVLQSLTSVHVATFLGVRAPAPNGFLIFGGSKFSRMLALELMNKNIPVRIADTNWDSIRQARMDNIPTYYGNPISEHARRTMDLSAMGQVLVMSPYRQLNPLVTYHFEHAMGKGSVLGLSANEQESRASHQVSESYAKKLGLFSESATYGRLASLVAKGATMKTTKLSEAFTLEKYHETYGVRALPLCAIDPNGQIFIYTISHEFKTKADWQIVSLVTPETAEEKAAREAKEEAAKLQKEADERALKEAKQREVEGDMPPATES
ncbi:sodium:proton antiporter [Simiduia curdlanivorans]|uniref:Cation:proton antiporter n=1 Tax=Simiduia curdlanivorans TaxID=1492769 RepID=A0ABV8V8S4_9GAMM|nr:sodium:proton antiporter [Simiduia curdlanivorans]MDN3638879.1 sodium:proton antiporter [Simiduia curdlanivorans]